MALNTVGLLTPIEFASEQTTVLSAVERQIFVNETPLFGRLPHRRATSESYTITSYDVRKRAYAVGTGGITAVATTLPIADASPFLVGDVLEITDGTNTEYVEVTAAPTLTTTPNTLTIRRARAGTTAAAFVATNTVRLVGNSRTGAEIDQQASRPVVTTLEQYVQTFQFPVQIGGKAEAISNVALPAGASSVFGLNRAVKAVEFVRDVEYSMYYGRGEKPAASGDRAKMKGLRTLIAAYNGGANLTANAGASYTSAAFLAATADKIYDAGGMADVILCSTNFMGFLRTWVPGQQSIAGTGVTSLGQPIKSFTLALDANPLTFVPSFQLRPGTAIVLSSFDLEVRALRDMQFVNREKRGDAIEGDWIGDYTIHMNHPEWHAFVEGISSAA